MSIFCIPKHLIEKLKASAIKGEVNIKELYKMSSAERRDFFEKHTNAELGKFLNVEFEKAMVAKQQTALTDWAKSVFTPEAKSKPVYKSVLDKINTLDELGVLSPESERAFLQDLVSDKLGASVSPEEVAFISERAKKIDAAQEKLGNELGNPDKETENIAFFKAKKEMDDYLQSLSPASRLKVATGTIGRGMMLFSVKSPLLNIGSNLEVGITEALSRRLASRQIKGADDGLALRYVKMVNKVYQATGYDMSRMMSLNDTGASGERVLGETVHSQGSGIVRKIGRGIEDIVFKQLMGAPDVAFSSINFADSVNLNALKMAEGDKAKASEMMTDSMRIAPQTPEGEVLRAQGVLDAQTATWTDKTWASRVSEGIRKILNDVSGDMRIGDYLLPFVKTPANVIATGMDYAGMGIPKALVKIYRGIKTGELGSKENVQAISRDLVRAGLGITGAAIIASQLNSDDFVDAYDPARAQIESLRNSNYNAVRIGGKWISMDWFGPLAVPLTAMMYGRKYGKTGLAEMAFQYAKGVGSAALNIPGIADIYSTVKAEAYKKNQTLEEMTGATQDYLTSQIYSRLTPSILSDVAKSTDPFERQTGKGIEGLKAKIPGLRETLPIKTDIFGQQVKGESAISDILFGSRVKTSKENPLVTEINRVSNAVDKSINFTNWDKSSSKTLEQFKEKKGRVIFEEAKVKYGQELQKQLITAINNPAYNRLSDEEKLKIINNQDAQAMDKVFKRYGFKYHVPTKKPLPRL